MQKSFIWTLVIALTGSQALYASGGKANSALTTKTGSSFGGSPTTSPLPNDESLAVNTLASAEASEAGTNESVSSDLNRPSDIAEPSYGQVVSGSPSAPRQQPRHKHHLRNALIAFGACFALALVIAVAAK